MIPMKNLLCIFGVHNWQYIEQLRKGWAGGIEACTRCPKARQISGYDRQKREFEQVRPTHLGETR